METGEQRLNKYEKVLLSHLMILATPRGSGQTIEIKDFT